jgi:hypothetical protein
MVSPPLNSLTGTGETKNMFHKLLFASLLTDILSDVRRRSRLDGRLIYPRMGSIFSNNRDFALELSQKAPTLTIIFTFSMQC